MTLQLVLDHFGPLARYGAFDSLISSRCPSGSRKKQRISQSYSTGGVRNVAPLAFKIS